MYIAGLCTPVPLMGVKNYSYLNEASRENVIGGGFYPANADTSKKVVDRQSAASNKLPLSAMGRLDSGCDRLVLAGQRPSETCRCLADR